MRWGTLVVTLAACGRVGFDTGDPKTDAASADTPPSPDGGADAAIDPQRLIWLPFEDDPADGADNRGAASTTASCVGACPTLGSGKRGGAYVFAGGGLRLPRPTELALTAGTVMAWVRVDTPMMDGETRSVAAIPFGPEGKNSWEMYLRRTVMNGLTFTVGADAGTSFYVEKPWTATDGTWVHVALAFDRSGLQRLVIDGTTVGQGMSFDSPYDAHDMVVGGDEDAGSFVNPWLGAIDDFLVISRVLTDAEIVAFSQGTGL